MKDTTYKNTDSTEMEMNESMHKNTEKDENVRKSNDVLQDDCMYKNTASGSNDEQCSSKKEGTNNTNDDTGDNIEKQNSCMEQKEKQLPNGMNLKKIDSYEYFKFNIDIRRCLQRYIMKCTQWVTTNDHVYWYFGYYSHETSLKVKMTLIDSVQKNLEELEDFFQYALANRNCTILSYIEFISQPHVRIDEISICLLAKCYWKHVAIRLDKSYWFSMEGLQLEDCDLFLVNVGTLEFMHLIKHNIQITAPCRDNIFYQKSMERNVKINVCEWNKKKNIYRGLRLQRQLKIRKCIGKKVKEEKRLKIKMWPQKNVALLKPRLKTLKTKAKRKRCIQSKVDKKSSEVKDSHAKRSSMILDHDYTKKSCPVVVLRDISLDLNAEYAQKKHDIQKEDETPEFPVLPNMFELNVGKGDSTDSSLIHFTKFDDLVTFFLFLFSFWLSWYS